MTTHHPNTGYFPNAQNWSPKPYQKKAFRNIVHEKWNHQSFERDFFALLTKYQLVGYWRLSDILLIPTAVMIVMATPDKKMAKCAHLTFPDANTMAAAPAGG